MVDLTFPPPPAVAGLATLAARATALLWWRDYCSKAGHSYFRSVSTAAAHRSPHPKCEDGDKQYHADQEGGYLGSRVHAGASGARDMPNFRWPALNSPICRR